MLRISKLADYATVIMHWLARHPNERFSAAVVSQKIGIALPTVSKLLKLLSAQDLVTSTRGAQGGYHLSHPAADISLAKIIAAIDGMPALTECSDNDSCCQYDRHCELRGNWQYINSVIYGVLDQLTLDHMTGSLSASNVIPMQFHPMKTAPRGEHVDER